MGWRAEFTSLYRRWWHVTVEGASHVLILDADAQDAAQSVFARLWASGEWSGVQDPERFFWQAGYNAALSAVRRQRRRPTMPLSEALVRAAPDPSALDHLLEQESRARALQVISHLPQRCRLVCAMVFLDGLTHREAAAKLGVSVGAIEKQVARGRRHLRQIVGSAGAGPSTFVDGGGEKGDPASIRYARSLDSRKPPVNTGLRLCAGAPIDHLFSSGGGPNEAARLVVGGRPYDDRWRGYRFGPAREG